MTHKQFLRWSINNGKGLRLLIGLRFVIFRDFDTNELRAVGGHGWIVSDKYLFRLISHLNKYPELWRVVTSW